VSEVDGLYHKEIVMRHHGMKKRIYLWIILGWVLSGFIVSPLVAEDFDFDWRFSKGNFAMAMIPSFDDGDWRQINLPHDWSIEGPFSKDLGSGNGYAPGGIGWYRKHFKLDSVHKDKAIVIEFDGIYNNSEVWINGQFVGRRPYGYSSFQYDLTPHIKFGDTENVLAVRVDHTRFADSRWYTGSGIYRHVHLHIRDKLHIGHWGVYVTTPEVSSESGTVRIETTVQNDDSQTRAFSLQSEIVTNRGDTIGSLTTSEELASGARETFVQTIKIKNPQRWSINTPTLYTLKSRVLDGEAVLDSQTTPFGFRTLRFDPDKGFFLNDESVKLKGVCLHHDAGCLGAAVPDKVLEHRLKLMKAIGANAIRTSHNPPAPELLDICDRIGLLVMDEAFDEFTPPKNKWVEGRNVGSPSRFGYGEVFEKWSTIDVRDMILRDRNHPCIIMWSIGNEIDYPNDPFSHPVLGEQFRPEHPSAENMVKYAKPLVDVVKQWDKTRPVTMALASITMSNAVELPQILDVVGYNYQEQFYDADHKTYPNRFIYGSENGDSYRAWMAVRDNEYIAGQFLWTGIDYLGEANRWPNRAFGSGLVDLCGFIKPNGWFRKSLWVDESMVYICASAAGNRRFRWRRPLESWNWRENQTVNVLCYTNCPEVSLSLNDTLIGLKSSSQAEQGVLTWQVPFQAGTLKVVGLKDGQEVCEYVLRTAGPGRRIVVSQDVAEIRADGRDICFLSFEIQDENGVRVPDAENELTFELSGPARIIGIGNGDLNSFEPVQDLKHKAYRGRGLAILQSTRSPGEVTVKVTADGLEPALATLHSHQF
jgi:beta-galactosidase